MLLFKERPDLQKKLNIIKILIELREKANPKTELGFCIINAIDDPEFSDKEVLHFVKEHAQDSFKTMSDAIGEDLCNQVKNL